MEKCTFFFYLIIHKMFLTKNVDSSFCSLLFWMLELHGLKVGVSNLWGEPLISSYKDFNQREFI